MGRYREAIAAYDNALSIDSTYPYAWNGRGNANRALKLYGTALSDYDRAILYKPDFDEALYNKSLALLDLKQNQEAIKTLEKTIEVNPRHLQAIRKLQQIRNGK
jgi:tetratricopeptide (TPR) repeat protein